MNVDAILQPLNTEQVDDLLIGGLNFLLLHEPELTFDADVWVADTAEKPGRPNRVLRALAAAWGPVVDVLRAALQATIPGAEAQLPPDKRPNRPRHPAWQRPPQDHHGAA